MINEDRKVEESEVVNGTGQAQGSQTDTENVVRVVRNLVGEDVVLLPVLKGEKKPSILEWDKVRIEKMEDKGYLRQLEGGNIGVLLGSPSNGLCAIDIDDDAAVEPFLAVNPKLRSTLRSRGARGAQIWIRIIGEYPELKKVATVAGGKWGEWRADGGQSVIKGIHPSGVAYQFLHEAQPITMAFDEIKWPADLKLPWVKDASDLLAEEHGQAYTINEKSGALSINEYYFVVRFQREHLILWEPLEEEFYQYNGKNGLWEQTTEEKIKMEIWRGFQAGW